MFDVRPMIEADTAGQAAGIELLEFGAGWSTVAMTVTEEQLNGHGMCHGAAIFMLADIAFAGACNSHGRPTLGRSCSIEYLAPAQRGDRLEAHAIERMRVGRNGIYDVAVRRIGDDTLIAEFRGHSREFTPPQPADEAGSPTP